LDGEFDGRSVFEIDEDEERERRFQYYDMLNRAGDDYFSRMDEFVIKGRALDKSSWQFSRHLAPLPTHQAITVDFGTDEALGYLRSGWSVNHKSVKEGLTNQWALGSSASIFLSLPKNDRMSLTANVKTFLKSQQITIKVNGKKVGTWGISPDWKWERHGIFIEPDENRPNVSVVEFIFSQFSKLKGKDPRPLAVLFESINLKVLTE